MTAKSIAFTCLSLTATAGLVAILVADEVRNMATHSRWLQHDVNRPKPPVVDSVGGSAAVSTPAPKDAVILFDGTNLDAWRTPEGTTGAVESGRRVHGGRPREPARSRPRGNSGMFNCMSSGHRPTRLSVRARIAAIAAFS